MNRTLSAAAVSLIALAVAACGGDSSPTPAPAPADRDGPTVIGQDIGFAEDTYRAEPGALDITYRNDGSIRHTLVIESVDGFKLDVTGNGDIDQGTVDLEPGKYTIYRDVPGHREAGMEATLEIG